MKTLILTILTLGFFSSSAMADCYLSVVGDLHLSNCNGLCMNPIEKMIDQKGWKIVEPTDSRASAILNVEVTRSEPVFHKLYITGAKVDYSGIFEMSGKQYSIFSKGRSLFPNLPMDCATPLYQEPEMEAKRKFARKLGRLLEECK